MERFWNDVQMVFLMQQWYHYSDVLCFFADISLFYARMSGLFYILKLMQKELYILVRFILFCNQIILLNVEFLVKWEISG